VATGAVDVVVVVPSVVDDDDSVVAGGLAGLAVVQVMHLSISSWIISVCVAVDDIIIVVRVDSDGEVGCSRSRSSSSAVAR